MSYTRDEMTQLIEDLREGVSDDPTMAECRTATEAMAVAADLLSERQVSTPPGIDLEAEAKDYQREKRERGLFHNEGIPQVSPYYFSLHMLVAECVWADVGIARTHPVLIALSNEENS